MDDLRAGTDISDSDLRWRLIPHGRDVIEDQAKVLGFAWRQGSGTDGLGVHVGIARTDEAEGRLQYLGCVAGFVGECGLKGHRGNGAIAAILNGSINVGQLIAGKIARLADLHIAKNHVFRVGIDDAVGIGGRAAQPERKPEPTADHDQGNDPRHPVTFLPLRCTIDRRAFCCEEDGLAVWGGDLRRSRFWVVHAPIVTRRGGDGNNPEAGVNNEKTEKCLKDRIPFAETLVIDTAALSEWVQPLAAAFRSTVPAGASMLRALKKQTRKRSIHPQGDTIYRAAALAAALMMLAAAPFF